MTVEIQVTEKEIVETIHHLMKGEKTSYAVLKDADALTILPLLSECIQSMSIAANLSPNITVKNYLNEQKNKLATLNSAIQVQLVRNAEVQSKIAQA